MIYTSAAILRVALLVLAVAVVISKTAAIGKGSFRARPKLEPAVIRINGRTEVIDLQEPGVIGTGAATGAATRAGSGSMIRPAEDIISLELVSGPPTFGLFLTSRNDERFVSPTLNWIQPSIGDTFAFEDSSEDTLLTPRQSSSSSKKDVEDEKILLRAADQLFYYTLDNPDNQVVTVFQNTKKTVRFNIMDYTTPPEPRLSIPPLRIRKDRQIARWQFPRRQDVFRLAVVHAPRGRYSKCQVTIIGAWIDDIRIGRPLGRPKAGVGGIVCFR